MLALIKLSYAFTLTSRHEHLRVRRDTVARNLNDDTVRRKNGEFQASAVLPTGKMSTVSVREEAGWGEGGGRHRARLDEVLKSRQRLSNP